MANQVAKVKCPKCFYVNPEGSEICQNCRSPLPKIRIEARISPPPKENAAQGIQFKPGQLVAGRYTVISIIGRGGMGIIYKVHDNVLGEEVALKTLLPQFLTDHVVVERFVNEARIARRLAHPNIIRVHDIGNADRIIYISMEFLQGRSLRGILDALPSGKRLPLKQVLHIVDQLCAALEYAHQYTIHRDIKPENVMVLPNGQVKLMDFGISKLMAEQRLTAASVVMGTPFYMSPEQLRNSRDVDARSDIFSVGVLLYELLTGNVPTGVPKPASEIAQGLPPALDEIVLKCIDPSPDNRYQSASELRAALRPLLEQADSGVDLSMSRSRGLPRLGGLSPQRIIGALAAVLLLASTTGAMYAWESYLRSQEQAEAKTASTPENASAQQPADAFYDLRKLILKARERATAQAQTQETIRTIIAAADRYWQDAQEQYGRGEESAVSTATVALQGYLAAIMQRRLPGMTYVPPGNVLLATGSVFVPPFFIDVTEVTFRQFADFAAKIPEGWHSEVPAVDPAYDDHPVTHVAFYDAWAYASYNGKQLPTLAQWLRAAVGDKSVAFPWGDTLEADICNCGGQNDGTVPVKQFEKDLSWVRCYDMAGNVSEWTRTLVQHDGTLDDGTLPDFGRSLAVCGGSYLETPGDIRQYRAAVFEYRGPELGFRCVKEIPTDPQAVEEILRLP